ncbi:MAG TPA: hypothetical protein P5571_00400 [Candidatus Krumholzibacteria bacterium]|nr:hypothetical protein [Candidatus Krumholzibacteria bacterium]HRX49816.1 hypothetical protein [Candidatus Krumholzibacteria bacterium]
MSPHTAARHLAVRLAVLLDPRVRLLDVAVDPRRRELRLRALWCGPGPRVLEGRAPLPGPHAVEERPLLLAAAQAVAALAVSSELGLRVLAGVRRRRPPAHPRPSRRGW